MLRLLVEACPTFEKEWRQFLTESADEAELPCYLAIGQFARHLSAVLAEGNEPVLSQVFYILERLLKEGDSYVREAAVLGIIEDLQNTQLHSGTNPEQYLRFLLPESRRWWDRVEAFWTEGRPLTDD